MTQPVILAFDTSGPWIGTALLRDGDVCAAHYIDMKKGQAEHLMPLIQHTLDEAEVTLPQLDAVGVGVGPGNFTGIRISVSAARGMALALGVPAIGVSLLDTLAYHAPRPCLATINAPRGMAYVQTFGEGVARPATMIAKADMADWITPGVTLIGQDSPELSQALGIPHAPAAFAPASAIARIAAERLATPQPRPAPLYIKPADAAPSREQGPTIL